MNRNRNRCKMTVFWVALVLLLSACTNTPQHSTERAENTTEASATAGQNNADDAVATTNDTGQAASSSLVVYFSRVGNTDFPADVDVQSSASLVMDGDTMRGNAELLAKWVSEQTGAPMCEIVTVEKYPAGYSDTTDQALQEQRDGLRPPLADGLEIPKDLQTLWLVLPNWWGDLPMPLYTFLEEYDLSGATINLLVTHGGSGFSKTQETIQKLQPDAILGKTLKIYHADVTGARDQVISWAAQ